MIFNPYQLCFQNTVLPQVIEKALPWAVPLLENNNTLVFVMLFFLLLDVLALCKKGVLRHQVYYIRDTRSARTFESSVVVYPWLKPLLLTEFFVFFGLNLFCLNEPTPSESLLHPTLSVWLWLGLYIVIPLVWFLFQGGLIDWLCYLFDLKEKRTIMDRSYVAAFVLVAPFALLLFLGVIAGYFSPTTVLLLLLFLFFLTQIAFIINGIKIFNNGVGSISLIIVYLCTLEIAPLWVLWVKLSSYAS